MMLKNDIMLGETADEQISIRSTSSDVDFLPNELFLS